MTRNRVGLLVALPPPVRLTPRRHRPLAGTGERPPPRSHHDTIRDRAAPTSFPARVPASGKSPPVPRPTPPSTDPAIVCAADGDRALPHPVPQLSELQGRGPWFPKKKKKKKPAPSGPSRPALVTRKPRPIGRLRRILKRSCSRPAGCSRQRKIPPSDLLVTPAGRMVGMTLAGLAEGGGGGGGWGALYGAGHDPSTACPSFRRKGPSLVTPSPPPPLRSGPCSWPRTTTKVIAQ